ALPVPQRLCGQQRRALLGGVGPGRETRWAAQVALWLRWPAVAPGTQAAKDPPPEVTPRPGIPCARPQLAAADRGPGRTCGGRASRRTCTRGSIVVKQVDTE